MDVLITRFKNPLMFHFKLGNYSDILELILLHGMIARKKWVTCQGCAPDSECFLTAPPSRPQPTILEAKTTEVGPSSCEKNDVTQTKFYGISKLSQSAFTSSIQIPVQ
jgi:hypothetical protein